MKCSGDDQGVDRGAIERPDRFAQEWHAIGGVYLPAAGRYDGASVIHTSPAISSEIGRNAERFERATKVQQRNARINRDNDVPLAGYTPSQDRFPPALI
jgi:hypothetical protein